MKKFLKILLSVMCWLLIIVLVYNLFGFKNYEVLGNSMLPNLDNGDVVKVDKYLYKIFGINRFDILVIKKDEDLIIKRVVGMPNETISYKDNTLIVDGNNITETFILDESKSCTCNALGGNNFTLCLDEITLGEDEYFVLGDNRYVSNDSRYLGSFDKDDIIGKVIWIKDGWRFRKV